jgi:hypothetical protein
MKVRRSPSEKPLPTHLVLSIKQPWAQFIIEGRKDVEVRSWTTLYRGPLWIHTGQKLDTHASDRFNEHELFRGGIIGWAELWGIRPFSAQSWEAWRPRHMDDSPFDEELAKYGWIFRNPKRLDLPIPVKGTTGLFRLPDAVERQLRRRVKGSR